MYYKIYYIDAYCKKHFAFTWKGNADAGIERAKRDAQLHKVSAKAFLAEPVNLQVVA